MGWRPEKCGSYPFQEGASEVVKTNPFQMLGSVFFFGVFFSGVLSFFG